ncbi:hypothetical protein R6Q57_016570, partial [Mikania cordata]
MAPLMHNNCDVQTAEDWLNPSAIVEAFETRAARMIVDCSQRITKFENKEEGDSNFANLCFSIFNKQQIHLN